MNFQNKYLKYKNKYVELKNQIGNGIGDFFNYSDDKTIKKIFYTRSDRRLHIFWSLTKKVETSSIKVFTTINDKFIAITESGSVYITRIPLEYDISPAFRTDDFM